MSALDHDRLRELLSVYAIDAVSEEERELVDVHLRQCPECREELAGYLEALVQLTDPDPAPADRATWEGIRRRLSTDGAGRDASARVVPLRRRAFPAIAAAAAVAACSVLVTLVVTERGGSGTPTVSAPIVSAEPSAQLAGSVKLFDPDSSDGHVVLRLRNVPDAPAGHHYEVWVLRPGEGAEMEAIGAFTPTDGRASLTLPLPGPGEYVALDISIQENAGPPEHSGTSLGGAKLAG